ncbi:unnamed protein product, partial [Didymodactylos carnosus]
MYYTVWKDNFVWRNYGNSDLVTHIEKEVDGKTLKTTETVFKAEYYASEKKESKNGPNASKFYRR